MKINEAVEYVQSRPDEDLWIRRVGWKAVALTVRDYRLVVVPSKCGHERYIPLITDLIADWEVISPDQVLDEEKQSYD